MLQIISAVLALILSLAACGLSWLLYRDTMAARNGTPGDLLVRMAEMEQEWASTLEGNTRFLKRLAKRDADANKRAAKVGEDAPESPNGAPAGDKAHLRALARQRGLL